MSDDMAAAHKRDMTDHQRMQDLSRTIAAFLNDPPRRTNPIIRSRLEGAQRELDRACERIVLTWN